MGKSKFITTGLLDQEVKNELALIQEIKQRVETIEVDNSINKHTHENLIVLSLITEEAIEKINKIDDIYTSYIGVEKPTTDVWYKKIN